MKSKRQKQLETEIIPFLKEYKRKAGAGTSGDPNDRHYSRKLEKKIKKMKPEELDELISGKESSEE